MKVKLLMTCTVDGKIAKDVDHFANWSGSEDKKYFKKITKESGVIIMGNNTFKLFKKPLPHRLNIVYTRQKLSSNDKNVLFTKDHPELLINKLEDLGYNDICIIGGSEVNTLFIDYIDEMHLTVSPKIFGSGLSLFSHDLDLSLELTHLDIFKDDSVLLIYSMKK